MSDADSPTFPIQARFVRPDAGWDADQESARRLLTPGEVYTIRLMEVGGWQTRLFLADVDNPPGGFNSVQFTAAYDAPDSEDGDDD